MNTYHSKSAHKSIIGSQISLPSAQLKAKCNIDTYHQMSFDIMDSHYNRHRHDSAIPGWHGQKLRLPVQ